MLRAASMFGLAGIFLLISSKLRDQIWDAIGIGVATMDFYSPYSYIAGGLAVLSMLLISLYRGAQVR